MAQESLTCYGFRYVSVTATETVTITGLTGKVATSAVHETGAVTTDAPDTNQLVSNIRWGQRGNAGRPYAIGRWILPPHPWRPGNGKEAWKRCAKNKGKERPLLATLNL